MAKDKYPRDERFVPGDGKSLGRVRSVDEVINQAERAHEIREERTPQNATRPRPSKKVPVFKGPGPDKW